MDMPAQSRRVLPLRRLRIRRLHLLRRLMLTPRRRLATPLLPRLLAEAATALYVEAAPEKETGAKSRADGSDLGASASRPLKGFEEGDDQKGRLAGEKVGCRLVDGGASWQRLTKG